MLKNVIYLYVVLAFCITNSYATKGQGHQLPPTFVETVTIKLVAKPDQVASTGNLVSIPGIIVKPEISGRITKVYFKSGDVIAQGSPLIEINPDIIRAQLHAAEAELKLAKLNFDRSAALYKTKDISKSDFDQAQANYNSAKAKAEGAAANLRQTTVYAPFAGKVGISQVNLGDYIKLDQNIVSLQTIDPLKVDFSLPEIYQSKVAINQEVILHSDAYPDVTFSGKVEAFESLIDQNTRTLNIRANVPNPSFKLMPGGFVSVKLIFAVKNVMLVPQTAVVYMPEGNYVFKVVDGKAQKTLVSLGAKDSDNVIVKSGLKVGDVVITAGQMKLHPGSPVIIADNKKVQAR